MSSLLPGLRHTVRNLFKSPAFTYPVIAMLTFGIGATTTMFSLVDGVLLKPLDFPDADRLVRICAVHDSVAGFCVASPPDVDDLSRGAKSLQAVGVGRGTAMSLELEGQRENVSAALVSVGYLPAFGVQVAAGRLFTTHDFAPGQPQVALLSHELWKSRFGGRFEVLGTTLTVDGEPRAVVGVLSPGFSVPELEATELWVPIPASLSAPENRGWRGFQAVGRLADGTSLPAARNELAVIASSLGTTYPDSNRGWGLTLVPLLDRVVGGVRSTLWTFFAAVTLVLLITCVNVASLLLARGINRQLELAIRSALGADPRRLLKELMFEGSLLAMVASALGLLLAHWSVRAFVRLAPADLPRLDEVGIDSRIILFTILLAFLATLLFGLVPARRAARAQLSRVLAGSAQNPSGHTSFGGRGLLVVAEIALALVLTIGAGLLIRSFVEATRWKSGFVPENLLKLWVRVPTDAYPERAQVLDLYRRLGESVGGLPGVESVGAASAGPLFGGTETETLWKEERPDAPLVVRWFDVDERYFSTLKVPLVGGRGFDASDRAGTPAVALVNETLARRLAPKGEVLGSRVVVGEKNGKTLEIIGVVGDIQPLAPQAHTEPEIYWPQAQAGRWATYFVVRTHTDPAAFAGPIRARLEGLDSAIGVRSFATFEELIREQLVAPRFHMALMSCFAVIALVLAIGGTYSVLSYNVSSRTLELGLRMSLGATRKEVIRLVVLQGLRQVGLGIGLGLIAAVFASSALSRLLFGIQATHLSTYTAMTLLLLLIGFLASYLPARRASRLDPLIAMRCEGRTTRRRP